MGKLDGKVALITGGSMGIGRGIARAFADEGCRLALTARTASALEEAAAEMVSRGAEVVCQPADVADPDQMDIVFKLILDRFGRLDILVNNAGAFDGGPIDELSLDKWDRVIATNLRGPFICTQAAMRIMKRQKCGRIINIGSISAQRVRPNSAPYSASKFGLWGLTQVTALDGREHGITCGCLHPGNTMIERRQVENDLRGEPMMKVEHVVEVARVMATLPPDVAMLEAIVLPRDQEYIGRG